jgi:hypothetical protein
MPMAIWSERLSPPDGTEDAAALLVEEVLPADDVCDCWLLELASDAEETPVWLGADDDAELSGECVNEVSAGPAVVVLAGVELGLAWPGRYGGAEMMPALWLSI